jgi:hypothetical protein
MPLASTVASARFVIPAGCLALAGLSLLAVPAAPSYDAWSWLIWGREVSELTLSTEEGPAFKPLAVAVCALLAPAGSAAPALWVVIARAAAILAVVLAFGLARRLAAGLVSGSGGGSPGGGAGAGSTAAGVAAAAGVALTGGYLALAAGGSSEGILLALALGGATLALDGHPRAALACAVGCALIRVETWPFLVVAGMLWLRRHPEQRILLATAAAGVLALWLVPELLASGELLRSAGRARVPNPGQPALAEVPALASLGSAASLVFWPVAAASLALPANRLALLPAAGVAWIAIVAAMAQLGFSGEERYALPGAALLSVGGAVGLAALARRPSPAARAAALALAALAVALALPRIGELGGLRDEEAYQARMAADLREAVAAAGGRRRLLACGGAYVGRYRGPLLAHTLAVEKRRIDFAPRAPGVVFRSRLDRSAPPAPDVPQGFAEIARAGTWTVFTSCGNS